MAIGAGPLDLAARCEAAEGADGQLDHAIGYATCPERGGWPHYTASIDAALTLVPEEYSLAGFAEYDPSMGALAGKFTCSLVPRDHAHLKTYEERVAAMGRSNAATPALALCAAALRARKASAKSDAK